MDNNVVSFPGSETGDFLDRSNDYYKLMGSILSAVMETEGPAEILSYLAWEMKNASEDATNSFQDQMKYKKWQGILDKLSEDIELDLDLR